MKKLRAIDLYCGAGGTTTGAEQSGKVEVVLAVNHWRPAILAHRENYPNTRHIHARIDHVDPQEFAGDSIEMIFASPECTHHSSARGGRPVEDQKRAGGWDVVKWLEVLRPRYLVLENVREWLDWGPVGTNGRPLKSKKGETFKAWVAAVESLGYRVEWRLLNAADYGEATSRTRLFVVARIGNRAIRWPEATHAQQANGKPRWRAAAEIIDWGKPCPSIFTRKKPLVDKTLKRIETGLRKFCSPDVLQPFLVKLRGTSSAADVAAPLPTLTAGGNHNALAMPFLVQYHNGPDGANRSTSPALPVPVIDANPRHALAMPFITEYMGKSDVRDTGEPLSPVLTRRKHALTVPFVVEYYGTGGARSVAEPLSTLTTKHRHGLAMASLIETMQELHVADIGFRMLDVDELMRAQGFPDDYALPGTKTDATRLCGNAVCPGVARALIKALVP